MWTHIQMLFIYVVMSIFVYTPYYTHISLFMHLVDLGFRTLKLPRLKAPMTHALTLSHNSLFQDLISSCMYTSYGTKACTRAHRRVCMHVCMYACMHACTYVCMCVCLCMHRWMDGWMGVCMYVCMYASTHVCPMFLCPTFRTVRSLQWRTSIFVHVFIYDYLCIYFCWNTQPRTRTLPSAVVVGPTIFQPLLAIRALLDVYTHNYTHVYIYIYISLSLSRSLSQYSISHRKIPLQKRFFYKPKLGPTYGTLKSFLSSSRDLKAIACAHAVAAVPRQEQASKEPLKPAAGQGIPLVCKIHARKC